MADLPALPSGFEIDTGDVQMPAAASSLPALPSGYVVEDEAPQEAPVSASVRKAKESAKKTDKLRQQLIGTDVNMFPGGFSDVLRQNLQNIAGAPRIPRPTAIAESERRAKDLAQAYQSYSGEDLGLATTGYLQEAPYIKDREPAKPESQLKTLARKTLRYGGATAGGLAAGLAATPETLGIGTIPAATAGAMGGYAAGRGLEELMLGEEPVTAYTDRPFAQAATSWGLLPEVTTPGQRAYKGGTLGQGLKEMALNIPDSTARLVEGAIGMPFALSKATVTAGGGEQTAKDMYHTLAAPLGLMGSDAAKDAWILDPTGSALAATMVYQGPKALKNRAMTEIQLNNYISKKYPNAVGMSSAKIASDPALQAHLSDAQGAVKTIVALNDEGKISVGDFGSETARLPRNRMEFAQAIQQAKEHVFNIYNNLKVKAGEKGVSIGLEPLVNELDSMAENSALKDFRPNVVQKIQELSTRLKERGSYTVDEANNAIKIANQAYENYLKNPSVETGEMAVVDAFVANHLRKAMDLAIDAEAGPGWQAYRNKYKQLRSIEKEVTKGALSEAKKSPIGLLDFSDMFSAGEAISGIISMNPAQFAKGSAMFMLKRIYKNLKDPHTAVTKIFEKTDSNYKRSGKSMTGEPWIGTREPQPEGSAYIAPTEAGFNPEVAGEPKPQFSKGSVETIGGERALGLEEGGMPPEKPVPAPERVFGPGEKASIVSPPDMSPQSKVNIDIPFARQKMTEMGMTPEQINTAIEAMKKGGVAAGVAILAPFLTEEDRNKLFGTGAMLGMIAGPKAKGFGKAVKFSDLTDKQQRFWFSDKASTLKQDIPHTGETTVGDLIKHDILFENYPEMADVRVRRSDNVSTPAVTSYGIEFPRKWRDDTKYYLLHEIQHIIQDIDGLSQGGSTAAIPQYMKNAAQGDKAAIKQQIDDLTKQRSELSGVKNVTKRWSIDYKIDELKNALEMIDNDTARYVYDRLLGEEEARRTSKQSSMKDEVVQKNPYAGSDIIDTYNLKSKRSNNADYNW